MDKVNAFLAKARQWCHDNPNATLMIVIAVFAFVAGALIF